MVFTSVCAFEVMEKREKLEEATSELDLQLLENAAIIEKEEIIKNLFSYFREGKLNIAAQFTIKLRYIEKFLQELRIKRISLKQI